MAFEQDYEFVPTPEPMQLIPIGYREGLRSRKLHLVCLRYTERPEIWGIVDIGAVSTTTGKPPPLLAHLPAAACTAEFDLLHESRAQILTLKSATGQLARWSLFEVNRAKDAKTRARRLAAQECAAWFNRQARAKPVATERLRGAPLALLARGAHRDIWMYRSLADVVLQLVHAGQGSVEAEGKFVPYVGIAHRACAALAKHPVQLSWTKPLYNGRQRAKNSQPRWVV